MLMKNLEKINLENNIVEANNVLKTFGDVRAVDGLTFFVKPGEIFGLLGPNGAGKTTMVKLILGILELDAGEITVFDMLPSTDELAIKQNIGYVSEEPLIYKSMTPQELFNFTSSIRKLNPEDITTKLRSYLESLEAEDYYDKLIATLSRGNKQKMQIIAALLHEPNLLIMDEPLTGLDAKSAKVVKEILELHAENGGSVIFSTHILEVAEDVCDRICIINKGKEVATGTMDELSKLADKAGADLEEIFLKLTQQDESVNLIVNNLRKLTRNGNSR
jgi:ABC-2 type transport system ATP-binding protein